MKHSYLIAIVALILTATLSASPAKGQGFFNGGFETPGTTTPAAGWTPAASGYSLSTDSFSGSFAAELASPELNAAVFTQNSIEQGNQPPLVEGSNPLFSFQAKGFAGTTGNVLFALRYLNDDGVILSDSGNQFFQTQINPIAYTEISFDLGVVPAGATAAFVEFSQAIGPINGQDQLPGSVLIDEISLVDPTAVPEPGSASIVLLGGMGMWLQHRRKRF